MRTQTVTWHSKPQVHSARASNSSIDGQAKGPIAGGFQKGEGPSGLPGQVEENKFERATVERRAPGSVANPNTVVVEAEQKEMSQKEMNACIRTYVYVRERARARVCVCIRMCVFRTLTTKLCVHVWMNLQGITWIMIGWETRGSHWKAAAAAKGQAQARSMKNRRHRW